MGDPRASKDVEIQFRSFDEIDIGDQASVTRTISDEDIRQCAQLTGDYNPLHVDDTYAVGTRFGRRIAHGVISIGLISSALTRLTPGCAYVSQEIHFVKPVFIGDTITASVMVCEKHHEKKTLKIDTMVTNQSGEVVVRGYAILLAIDRVRTSRLSSP